MSRNVGAIVLAAGSSRRMGAPDKLLIRIGDQPMVRVVVDTAVAAGLSPVVVVTGPDARGVRDALEGVPAEFAEIADPSLGMSRSLAAGVTALSGYEVDAGLVLLGDMPMVTPRHIAALLDAFDPAAGRSICVPCHGGRRGNPVLWAADYFPEIEALEGDHGARRLLSAHAEMVHQVPVADAGVLVDADTPEDVERLRAQPRRPTLDNPGRGTRGGD
jgi:molybdenum cofactor cytidylyltransferase